MSKYINLIKLVLTLTISTLSDGFSSLKGSTVQLKCPYRATVGQRIAWSYISTTALRYSENSLINPNFPTDLKERLNITGNHTIGEYHLNISDIRESDEGTYECLLSGSAEIYREQLTVIVEPVSVKMDNVLLDDKLQGTEGLDLIITCRAVGGKPAPDVKLLIAGSTVASGIQSLQHTLPSINRSNDRKTIVCYAGYEEISHYALSDSVNLYLILKPLPPIILHNSEYTEETVPLNVSCTSHGSRPAAKFTWLIGKNNKDVTLNSSESRTLDSSSETFTVTSTLIYRADRTCNGQFVTCKASNIVSSNVSSSKLLNIRYAPNAVVENKTFLQTDRIRNVQCSIQGNPSEYTYSKCSHKSYYDVIIRELAIGQSGILTLPDIRMEFVYQDSGIYVCTVGNGILGTNGQEKQVGHGFVKINSQPVFTKGNSQNLNGVIGRSVDVNVYVFSEPKYTTFRWYKNTTLLKQSAKYNMNENRVIVNDDFHGREVQLDGYRLTLVIDWLRFEDAAVYKLQLSNAIGNLVEHNMILKLGHIPHPPSNITVVSVGETSLTIQWMHVDDKDMHLMYHIEYKVAVSLTWIRKETGNKGLLYTLDGLQTSTYYNVRVLAENSFNKSLPSLSITAQTLSKGNKANDIQSATIPVVALATSSTIITIVVWFVLGLFWFKRKKNPNTKRNKTDSSQHHSDTEMYDIVTDSARIKTDQGRDIRDSTGTSYEYLGIKDKPSVYSEFTKEDQG
ncbi:protein turtle-like [Mytilus edulis]|uniref:protein turtle-like n=1 Tax=Mytilus edulis TaxID=6550 RepID=UPI0039F07994